MTEPDRYGNDVDWDIIKSLKKLGLGLVRDNSIMRGPLKTISSRRYEADDIFKFNQTTAHQKNMKDALGNRYFPVDSKQFPTDTIEHWGKNMAREAGRKRLIDNGWLRADGTRVEIDYFFNKQGLRHDGTVIDIMDGHEGGVIYLGDSHTMGVGLAIEDTWTYIAHHECEKTKDLRLKRYIRFLKPNLVVMSYPWQNTRTEMFNARENIWEVQTVTKSGRQHLNDGKANVAPVEWFHTAQSYIRWYKNLEAMKWLCHEQGAKLYAVEEEHEMDETLQEITNKLVHQIDDNDLARDLVHYGRKTHRHNGEVLAKVLDHIL